MAQDVFDQVAEPDVFDQAAEPVATTDIFDQASQEEPKQTAGELSSRVLAGAAEMGLSAATMAARGGTKIIGPIGKVAEYLDFAAKELGGLKQGPVEAVQKELVQELEGATSRTKDDYAVDPRFNDNFLSAVASGAGSILPILASGPFAPLVAAGAAGEQGLQEAEQAGGTQGQQFVAAAGNAATAYVTEKLLGLPALLKSVKAVKMPDEAYRSLVSKVVEQAGRSFVREGTQETLEEVSSDLIAKYIAAYDPNRDAFDAKKLAKTFAAGGIIGGTVGGVLQGIESTRQNTEMADAVNNSLAEIAAAEPPLTQVPPVVQEDIFTTPPPGEGDVFAGVQPQPKTTKVSPFPPQKEGRSVISTAIQLPTGEVVTGTEWNSPHASMLMEAMDKGLSETGFEQNLGFIIQDEDGNQRFATRAEALEIARETGQVDETKLTKNTTGLQSEGLIPIKGGEQTGAVQEQKTDEVYGGVPEQPVQHEGRVPAPESPQQVPQGSQERGAVQSQVTQDEAAKAIEPFRDASIAMAKNQGATDINAEDIFQEVQIELSRQVAEGKTDLSKIGGLVSKAIKNKTANFLQKESRQKRGGGMVQSGDIEGPTGETEITEAATTRGPRAESVSQEDIQTIEQAVESLPESERNVMKLMVDNPGMSDAEIGKQVGLTENAVRQAKFRARNKLKEFIRSQGIGERMAPGASNEKEFQRARYIAGTDIYMGLESAGQLTRETWERNMERIYEDTFTPAQLDDAWRIVQLAAQEAKETRKPVTSVISQMMGVEQGREGITALKNAQADLERRKRGLPAAMDAARRSQPSVWDEAMRLMDATDGRYQEDILAKLRNDPRATLNDVEIMTLLHAKIQAENLFDTYVQEVNSAKDRDSQLVAIQKAKDAEAKLIEIYDLAKQVGSEQGRAFAARRMLVARDYSIPRLTAELRAAQLGEELSTEQKELVQKISENVERTDSELETRTAELEEEQSRKEFEQAVREFQSQPKIDPRILALAEKIVARLDAAAAKARERILSRMQRLNSGLDPTFLYDYAIIGASKIAHGLKDLAWRTSMRDEFGDGINPYLDDIYQKSDEMINNLENEVPEADRPKVRKAVRKTEAQDVIKSTTAEIKTRMEGGESLREMRFQVQKMALELVRSGVTTPDGLLDAMHAILEPIQPGMTRRQVMDLISGYGDLKALDMESAKVTLRDLKGQYQQLAKLEDIQGGLEPAKTGIERRKPSMTEKELIRRVNEARQKFGVGTLEAYKARLQNQIADLELRIKRKDFRKKIRKSVDISKDAEAVRLLAENERWKRKFAEARYEAKKSAETKFQKAQRYGKEILNVPRAVKSSLDFSAVLRQGGFISLGNPLRAARNLAPMFKAAVSQKAFEESEAEIRSRPNANKYKQSKLYLASMDGDLSNREEAFRSEFSDKIPGVKGSNRAYIGFLNRMRADTFDALVNNLPHTPTPEQLQAIAHYINVATGRGDLGAHGSAAETLSTVLWSPRLLISRIQLLAAEPLARKNAAGVRKVIAKEYGKALTGAAIVIALGLAAGADLEDDPRSSDFGKLKFGNTRVDPWMGLQQITVLGSRLGTGETKTQGGEILSLRKTDDKKRPPWAETGFDVSARFLRTKMTPLLGEFFNVVSGETVVGEKVTPATTAQGLLLPLSIGDVLPIMEEQGVPRGVALQILNLFGMSVQHYDKNKR